MVRWVSNCSSLLAHQSVRDNLADVGIALLLFFCVVMDCLEQGRI